MKRPNQELFAQDSEDGASQQKSRDNPKMYKTSNTISVYQRKPKIRYKLLLVFSELVELSQEFFDVSKITLAYSFLGLEAKFVLGTADLSPETNSILINKVKLYYFFGDNTGSVNELLRQKDVQLSHNRE